jgi:hypothetical protein
LATLYQYLFQSLLVIYPKVFRLNEAVHVTKH